MLFSCYSFMMPVYAEEISEKDSGAVRVPDSVAKLESSVSADATVTACEANLLNSGELQVVVKASGTPNSYKLWKMSSGGSDYSLVCESKYPVLIYTEYAEGDKFAVSVTNGTLDSDSEKYEVTNIRYEALSSTSEVTWCNNILKGLKVVPNPDAQTNVFNSVYGYDRRYRRYGSAW